MAAQELCDEKVQHLLRHYSVQTQAVHAGYPQPAQRKDETELTEMCIYSASSVAASHARTLTSEREEHSRTAFITGSLGQPDRRAHL